MKSFVVDTHAHVFTEEMIAQFQKNAPSLNVSLTDIDADGGVLRIAGIVQKPFPRSAWDLDRRIKELDAWGVDFQIVANVPHTFLYESEAALTNELAIMQNDAIAAFAAANPKRFGGLATLPMQAPKLAAAELRRAMKEKGLKGFHLGSNIGGKNLDEPDLDEVWEVANELKAFVLVHPHKIAAGNRLESYYLKNLIGNPLETTIAGASLVFGGVVERFPNISFCLVHGGGFVPYQLGRFRHGWDVRNEPRLRMRGTPEESLSKLYYDTITHNDEALDYLVKTAGADRVLYGSDYPFDMADDEGPARVKKLKAPEAALTDILSGNAKRLLNI
ncbi:amidohydrolase [Terrihabitans soli]|uniref:Amidohydrolase n=1 Tax=Terrihabitans soli TaxID=708113 RepID=A0A6S6QSB9_9HYPH|nr:amidohydrolase family protein [Terrihabitans soli]BCJ89951.1 amidohydrolase [Terrihabitans soli]